MIYWMPRSLLRLAVLPEHCEQRQYQAADGVAEHGGKLKAQYFDAEYPRCAEIKHIGYRMLKPAQNKHGNAKDYPDRGLFFLEYLHREIHQHSAKDRADKCAHEALPELCAAESRRLFTEGGHGEADKHSEQKCDGEIDRKPERQGERVLFGAVGCEVADLAREKIVTEVANAQQRNGEQRRARIFVVAGEINAAAYCYKDPCRNAVDCGLYHVEFLSFSHRRFCH